MPARQWASLARTDAGAALVAAAILLPQASAFGISLYTDYGPDAASGAVAGLSAAIVLCLVTGIVGGTRGLISSPTGPMLVLMAAIASALSRAGLQGGEVLAALSVVFFLGGVAQVLIGLSGGGRLVKFIPVPVVAGFMTGSGILMIWSQYDALGLHQEPGSLGWWLPLITAATTLAAIYASRRFTRLPAALVGIVAGVAVFNLIVLISGMPDDGRLVVGRLAEFSVSIPDLPPLATLPWGVIIVGAVVLGIFASLDTLLTSVIADTVTGTQHDSRRELAGQGIGNLLSGLLGNLAGAGTTGATVAAIRSGGRNRPALYCAIVLLAVMLIGGRAASVLPVSALAAVIIHIGITLISRNIAAWWQRRRTRTDALVALLVTGVTVAYDLMLAVAVGIVIAAIQVLVTQIAMPVILRRATGREVRSLRVRPGPAQTALREHGERIVFYELRGALFFATAEILYEQMQPDLDRSCRIVVSFRRVSQVDLTGISLLHQMWVRSRRAGGEVVFANVHKRTGLGSNVGKTFAKAGLATDAEVRTFRSSDIALEYAENALLRELGVPPPARRIEFTASELCRRLSTEQRTYLAQWFVPFCASADSYIYMQGEPGNVLYVLVAGDVDIRVPTSKRHYSRVARMGPGMFFGEVSFNTPGPHTASAFATSHCELRLLDRNDFDRLAGERPDIALAVLSTIGVHMGNRLREANREIFRLNRF